MHRLSCLTVKCLCVTGGSLCNNRHLMRRKKQHTQLKKNHAAFCGIRTPQNIAKLYEILEVSQNFVAYIHFKEPSQLSESAGVLCQVQTFQCQKKAGGCSAGLLAQEQSHSWGGFQPALCIALFRSASSKGLLPYYAVLHCSGIPFPHNLLHTHFKEKGRRTT